MISNYEIMGDQVILQIDSVSIAGQNKLLESHYLHYGVYFIL